MVYERDAPLQQLLMNFDLNEPSPVQHDWELAGNHQVDMAVISNDFSSNDL